MNESFILYTSYYAIIEGLTDEQLGRLTRALYLYARDGEIIELDPVVSMAFAFIKDNLDRNAENYQKKCERNRENIRKRWNKKNTNEYDRIRTNTTVYDKKSRIPYDNDNDNDNEGKDTKVSMIPNIDNNNTCNKLQVSPKTEFCDPEKPLDEKKKEKKSKKIHVDYASIKDYWNAQHDKGESSMSRVTMMSERRETMVRARLRQAKGDMSILFKAIDNAMASDFLNGNNSRGWVASFDWIFGNENNFAKVLDGYVNRKGKDAAQQHPTQDDEPSIGELYKQQAHERQRSQKDVDKDMTARYLGMIEILKTNPRNLCRGALVSAYKSGELQRLGIEWKP